MQPNLLFKCGDSMNTFFDVQVPKVCLPANYWEATGEWVSPPRTSKHRGEPLDAGTVLSPRERWGELSACHVHQAKRTGLLTRAGDRGGNWCAGRVEGRKFQLGIILQNERYKNIILSFKGNQVSEKQGNY